MFVNGSASQDDGDTESGSVVKDVHIMEEMSKKNPSCSTTIACEVTIELGLNY